MRFVQSFILFGNVFWLFFAIEVHFFVRNNHVKDFCIFRYEAVINQFRRYFIIYRFGYGLFKRFVLGFATFERGILA